MRTIKILDTTYVELEEILKMEHIRQIKSLGYVVCQVPEDMIPWLIGYYVATEEARKTGGTEYTRDKNILTRIKELEVQ